MELSLGDKDEAVGDAVRKDGDGQQKAGWKPTRRATALIVQIQGALLALFRSCEKRPSNHSLVWQEQVET